MPPTAPTSAGHVSPADATDRFRATVIALTATMLHADWQREYRTANGTAPRWAPARVPNETVPPGPPGTTRIALGGNIQIDLANRDFADLTPTWQADHAAAAVDAVDAAQRPGLTVEARAGLIHAAWVDRNEEWAARVLCVPYDDLPPAEQRKDVQHLIVAATAELQVGDPQRRDAASALLRDATAVSARLQAEISRRR